MKKIFNWWFWSNAWSDFKCIFNPRQRWLTKKIPNHWCDKVELIRIMLFECLVHYVDGEKCFENVAWDNEEDFKDSGPNWEKIFEEKKETKAKILKCYDYITKQRPQLDKDLYKAYPEFTNIDDMINNKNNYLERYAGVISIEAEMERLDNETLFTILELRQVLWT
jgi:hypothetical protein